MDGRAHLCLEAQVFKKIDNDENLNLDRQLEMEDLHTMSMRLVTLSYDMAVDPIAIANIKNLESILLQIEQVATAICRRVDARLRDINGMD